MNKRSAGRGFVVGLVAVAVILVGAGCIPSPRTARQAAPGVPVKRVEITARSWEFVPSLVLVKANNPVELVVTSTDVDHGIEFTDLDVPMERVPAGRTVTIRFIPDKPGVYNFRCAVVCGTGHERMQGLLIVE